MRTTDHLNTWIRLVVAAAMALVVGVVLTTPSSVVRAADPVVAIDDAGPDDEPGQKDLNALSIDYGDPGAVNIAVTFNFDNTSTTGANTLDGCALFDTDSDGLANFSQCHTIASDGTQTMSQYECTADSRSDRCGGPSATTGFASTSSAAIVAGSDPFQSVPSHTSGNTCKTNPACYTADYVVTANIAVIADFGSSAKLINVCSYPSREPNSDPSDCVFAPNNGFLTIVKTTDEDTTQEFLFDVSEASANGSTQFSTIGAGTVSTISYAPTTTLDIAEIVPAEWSLASASCAIQTAIPTATGAPTATGVDNLEIRSGLETVCTFDNDKRITSLTLVKQVVNDNGGTAVATDWTVTANGPTSISGSGGATSGPGFVAGTYELSESVGPAGYALTSLTCDKTGDEQVTSVDLDIGDNVTCTFVNDDIAPSLNLIKIVNGGTAQPGEWTLSAGSYDPALPRAGTYPLSESGPSGYTMTSLTCTDTGDAQVSTVTLDLGEAVTCTFVNTLDGGIVVEKTAIGGDGEFGFAGSVSGSIQTVGGATPVGSELFQQLPPGTYSVAETPEPGWTLTATSCSDGSPIGSIAIAAGEVVTCTFENTRNAATFTLQKAWGDGTLAGEVVDLDATVDGPAPLSTAIDATATSPNGAAGANTMTIRSGQTVTFSEAFQTAGAGDGYITSLDCGALGSMILTPTADGRGGSLAVGSDPTDVTCTFTNTPRTAGVALQKNWVNGRAGDVAGLSLSTAPTGDSDAASSVAPAAPVFGGAASTTDNTGFVGVVAGDTVTFTEDLGAVAADYTTSFSCVGAANDPVQGADVYTWTLAISTADVNSGDTIFCSFTNTRIEVDLTLAKDWDDAVVGDTVTLAATGTDAAPISYQSVANAADETDTSAPFTVFAGETVDLSETWSAGDPAAYDTTLSCTGGSDTDVADGKLTIDPQDTSITCTWVNARRSVDVVVAKSLAPAVDDGAFDLSINGDVVVTDAADGDSNAATPVEVLIGDGVTVGEAAGAGAPALVNYTSSLACDNGITLVDNTDTAGAFVVPSSLSSGATITCTFTNTRKQAPLTVVKSWADSPQNADTVSLTITGGLATPTDGVDSNDGDAANDVDANTAVYAGETITVTEAFTQGSALDYDSTLVCSDATGELLPSTEALTGEFAVPATPTAITCTFTNTRIRGELTLRKSWVDAASGDTADLTVAGEDPASPATARSVASLGDSIDVTNTAVLTVYSGETVGLDEIVSPGANYTSSLTCDGSVMSPTGSSRSYDLTIAPGDRDAQILCEFRNVRRQITIELTKDWATSPANGDTVSLDISGSLSTPTAGVDSNNSIDDDSAATVQALAGETVTLTESFTLGLAENYTTTLRCVDAQGASVGADLTYTDGALSGQLAVDAADAGTTVSCAFTNTRKSTDLSLTKNWVAGVVGDTSMLTITGTDSDTDTAFVPAGGTGTSSATADITVYAGETVTLTETLSTNTATYDATDFSCTGGVETPAWIAGDLSATLAVSAADVDVANTAETPITCTFTNTARRGTIVIVKSIDGVNDGSFDFSGDWSMNGVTVDPAAVTDPTDFSITTDGLTGTVTFSDVLIGSYAVSETDSGASFDGTSVTCVEANGDGGSGPVGGTALPLTGSIDLDDGETVTCTFTNTERSTIVVVKDAQPNAAQDFSFTTTEPAAFDLLADTFVLDDDDDGTASNTYTSVLVPGGETYSVTELGTPGWTLDPSSACSTGGAFNGATATITPAPGSTVTCTFVNTANPAGISATKSVSGQVGPWGPFEFTLSGGSFTGSATQQVDSVDTTADWTDLVEGESYTLTEAQVPGYEVGAEFECVVLVPGAGDFVALPDADDATDGFQFSAVAGAVYDCDLTNVAIPGTVGVTKSVTGVAADFAWNFEFTIDPAAAPSATQSANGTGNTTSEPVTWTDLVPGVTYTITETVPAGWTQGDTACTVTAADQSTADLTTASFTVQPGDSISCEFDNEAIPSDVEITKTVAGGVAVDWEFDFSISPIPSTETSPKTASGTGSGSDTVEWGDLVPGTTYTVAELANTNSTDYVAGVLACTGLDDLDGNDDQSFSFVAPLGGDGVEISCSITNTAQSDVSIEKTVDSVTRDAATGVWTITYLIDVTNAVDAGAAVYDLADEFEFGGGVSIVGGSVSVTNTVPGTIVTNPAFDGEIDTSIVAGQAIDAGATHTYSVSVDATVAVGPGTDGDCISQDGAGTGFLNTATVAADGGPPVSTGACAGFAQLTLVKTLVSDDGGDASLADFPLTAAGPATLSGVSGTTAVSSAVPAGEYALSEQELVDGYVNLGWACTGAEVSTASSVTLADGENATCTIVNDDQAVDLELIKDDGGIEAVAGGAPFDYTISVRNIGDRDVDTGEAVTVIDELPDGFSWVSFPASCSQAGQVLTCDVDGALLPAGGAAIVIELTVEADADAASGTYVNKASVTTDDDPVCEGEDCTPPPCPAVENNNVDCEETPVDRQGAVEIIKTDDVADGVSVEPGDTFTYSLVVTNTGLSTLLPGTHVEDDLPAQLEFVSVVGGAGWTCNDSDPIDCDFAVALAPGETAPSIVVTVRVAANATGDTIDNVAVVLAAVDRDCPTATTRLVQSFVPACNQVTDDDDESTPLVAAADLAIVKTASVDQVGAGGGFTWTLEIVNNGPGTAVDVVIGDLVPASLTVTGISSDYLDCSVAGNQVTCTTESLSVGAGGIVTITVLVPSAAPDGTITNVGTVSAATPDPDLSNNSDDATVDVVAQAVVTTTLPPVTLPRTGSDGVQPMVATALLLTGLGLLGLFTARRRQDVAAD